MSEATIERDHSLDFLKGLAMLAVVFGHMANACTYGSAPFNFVYSFHMPLLFWVSGWLIEKKHSKTLILDKLVSLGIPFVIWGILIPFIRGGLFERLPEIYYS